MKIYTQLVRGVIATTAIIGCISVASAQTGGGGGGGSGAGSGGSSGSGTSGTFQPAPGSQPGSPPVLPNQVGPNGAVNQNPSVPGVMPPTVPPPGSVPPGSGNAAMTNTTPTNSLTSLTNQMTTNNLPPGARGPMIVPPR